MIKVSKNLAIDGKPVRDFFFFGSSEPTLQVSSFDALSEVAKKLEIMEALEKEANDELCKFNAFFGDLDNLKFVTSDWAGTGKRFRNYSFIATYFNEKVSFTLSDVVEVAGERVFCLNHIAYGINIGFEEFAGKLLEFVSSGVTDIIAVKAGIIDAPSGSGKEMGQICRDAWSVLNKLKEQTA